MVNEFVRARAGTSGTLTAPLMPLKAKDCPTCPGANVTPPYKVPLAPSTESSGVPSARHQATSPEGGETQFVCAASGPGSDAKTASVSASRLQASLERLRETQLLDPCFRFVFMTGCGLSIG